MMPLRLLKNKRSKNSGFTLIELAVVIGIVAILASFGFVSYQGLQAERDAHMVQSVQAVLQSIVSQGAARLNVRPENLTAQHRDLILEAARDSLGQNANTREARLDLSGRTYTLHIQPNKPSHPVANYDLGVNGQVSLRNGPISGIPQYEGRNGIVHKT